MSLEHVTAFTGAMQRKDLEAMLSHMAGDVILNTPLMAEPVRGKEAIREVVGPLLALVDTFDFRETCRDPNMFLRFSRSPSARSSWTVWTIGFSIVPG